MTAIFVLTALMLLAIAVVRLRAYGEARWQASTTALLDRMHHARIPPAQACYTAAQLEGLPLPVQRYFRTVLREGQAIIVSANVQHEGTFNLHPAGNRWTPFSSQQWVQTHRPGFIWNACIRMLPGMPIYVHDAYIEGGGILNPSILGLFSLAGKVDAEALAQGEFVRFFAESVCYPTALLPSEGVCWTPVDERSARATATDRQVRASMLVRFDAAGLIESVCVEARPAMVGDRVVGTPWEGRWSNYFEQDGMLVPRHAEAAWVHENGREPYYRSAISHIAFQYAAPVSVAQHIDAAVVPRMAAVPSRESHGWSPVHSGLADKA